MTKSSNSISTSTFNVPKPELPRPNLPTAAPPNPHTFSIAEVVRAIATLVTAAESNDMNKIIPCVTDTVSAVRKVVNETAEYRLLGISQSNQVMIHLLSNLVKTVKANELESVKSIAILIVNELKNCLLLVQNLK